MDNVISLGLITGITKRKCNQLDTNIQRSYLPGRGLCLANPRREYPSSVEVTTHLVKHLTHRKHTSYQTSLLKVGSQRIQLQKTRKTQRHQGKVLDLAAEKGSSVRLTVLPLREMGSNLLKKEFCNAVKPQYGWSVDDIPSTYPRVFADKSVR